MGLENVPNRGSEQQQMNGVFLVSHLTGIYSLLPREPSKMIQNHLEIPRTILNQGVRLFYGMTERTEIKPLNHIWLLHINYYKYN